jgi:DNA-binding beta-propeller fold protein YncE
MNKFTIFVIVFIFTLGSLALAQEDQWIFEDVFVDFWMDDGKVPSDSYGIHGVAVAPDGNVWINFYDGGALEGLATEQVVLANDDTVHFIPLWILDPDTKEHVSFSPLGVIELPGGVLDSITAESDWSGGGRGIAVGIDGNILSTHWATLNKINYQTGAGMARWQGPSSMTDASQADDGKIFIGRVSGGHPVWILDADLVEIGTAVDTADGLSRSIEVSPDGKDIYRGTIWNGVGIQHYHSDLPGVLKHELVDVIDSDTVRFGVPAWASCLDWDPDGNLVAGFIKDDFMVSDTNNPAGSRWYAYDVSDPEYPIEYVIGAQQTELDAELKVQADEGGFMSPRGMSFTQDGEKMYLADFDFNMISVFVRNPNAIEVDGEVIARTYDLSQNYPNPFNPVTTIPFAIYKKAHVELKVYDVQGKLVDTLVEGIMNAGDHNIKYDANHLSTGNYFYQLKVEGHVLTKKMILVR